MITKEQIRDWLEVDKRKDVLANIEGYIDDKLKENLMEGKTTIIIPTMKYIDAFQIHQETEFMELWESPELSDDGKEYVQKHIIDKYVTHGFDVSIEKGTKAHTNDKYEYIKFKNIHKMIEADGQ